MDYFKDDAGYYSCVSEVDFGDVIVAWNNYKCNTPGLKRLGGMFSTVIYDSKTGKFLIKKHYRSDYMRAHCMPKLIEEAKNMMLKED